MVLINPICRAVMQLTAQAQQFLAALVIELRRRDSNVVPLRKVASCFCKIQRFMNVESERGLESVSDAGGEATNAVAELDSTILLLSRRLQAMGIINSQVPAPSSEMHSSDSLLSLGSLDLEDLCNTLLKVQEDPVLRELLEGGSPDSASARTPTLIAPATC